MSLRKATAVPGGGRMRIRAFPATMDDEYVKGTCGVLMQAMQTILRKGDDNFSHEEMYRNAYTMVLHKHGDSLYTGLKEVLKEHLEQNVRNRVVNSMNSHILETITEVWTDHTTAMVEIRDILMYMDRVYVQQNNVEPVYDLGLSSFLNEIICGEVGSRLGSALLEKINRERYGTAHVDWKTMKTACDMLHALGNGSRSVYEVIFENGFLEETSSFCQLESRNWITQGNADQYLQKVKNCLEIEMERADRFLDEETKMKLIEVLYEELVVVHIDKILEMGTTMIKEGRQEELADLCALLKRVDSGQKRMSNAVNCYLTELENYMGTLEQSNPQPILDEYVQVIVAAD